MTKINREKARTDLFPLIETIRELKHRQRQPRQPNWNSADAYNLGLCKSRATFLCSLIAQSRSRIHQRRFKDILEQSTWLELCGDFRSYLKEDDEPAEGGVRRVESGSPGDLQERRL